MSRSSLITEFIVDGDVTSLAKPITPREKKKVLPRGEGTAITLSLPNTMCGSESGSRTS